MAKRNSSIKHTGNFGRILFIEIVGWYGAGSILLAYALVSFGALGPDSLAYQLLNFTGALGVAVISLSKKATQPAVLNLVWAAVALIAVLGLVL